MFTILSEILFSIFGAVFGWFFRGYMDRRKRLTIFRKKIHSVRLAIERTPISNNPIFFINEDWPSRKEDVSKINDIIKEKNIQNFHKYTNELNAILDGPTQRPDYIANENGTTSPNYNKLRKKIKSILTKIETET